MQLPGTPDEEKQTLVWQVCRQHEQQKQPTTTAMIDYHPAMRTEPVSTAPMLGVQHACAPQPRLAMIAGCGICCLLNMIAIWQTLFEGLVMVTDLVALSNCSEQSE